MKSNVQSFGLKGMVCVAGLLLLANASGNAQAQQATDSASAAASPQEEVMVYAPFVVQRKVLTRMMTRKSSTGLELISVSRSVSFADLDLSDSANVTTLENRVHQAAQDACNEIERRYPKSDYRPIPANQDCVGNAVREAMVVVRQLEASATTN